MDKQERKEIEEAEQLTKQRQLEAEATRLIEEAGLEDPPSRSPRVMLGATSNLRKT